MSAQKNKFYLTTPIYYVNARPHIGHAYTTIVADVLARRHRLLGDDTFFLTGTDEHGQKIERSASAAGVAPQQFADQVSASFQHLWKRMGITNDRFIRTTDPHHKQGVQKLFADLYARGQIYLSSYTGQYSIGEEMFVEGPPGTIGPDGKPTETVTEENFFFRLSDYQLPLIDLIESGKLVITPEASKNEVLRFLTGEFRDLSEQYFAKNALTRGELDEADEWSSAVWAWAYEAGKIKKSAAGRDYFPGALRDLSVSRSSFAWGVPVPDAILRAEGTTQKHVIYVWLDALANYMTAIGYGSDDPKAQAEFEHYWPADLHLVGKEITRFHCVYWPAFLLAAGLPLPKQITAHGWLLFDNSKMSKSKGNIVRTETILDAFGALCPPVHLSPQPADPYSPEASVKGTASAVPQATPDSAALAAEVRPPTHAERDLFATDVLRYYLLREIPFGQDGSFSFDALITRYNADLANGYGNLVSRTLSMIEKYFSGKIPDLSSDLAYEIEKFHESIEANEGRQVHSYLFRQLSSQIDHQDFFPFMQGTAYYVSRTDQILSGLKPWKDKESPEATDRNRRISTYYAAESIRIITALLYPILPYATARVWSQLGLGDIEVAARNGELNNLQWGDLQPGTKLGPLAPIFPRADKGLAQIMTDMEERNSPATGNSKLETESATAPTEAPPDAASTHPGAPPRTSSLNKPSGPLPVGGSTALSTGPEPVPSHTDAPASGIFANQPGVHSGTTAITTQQPHATTQITIDDFAKVELRVAQILVAERIPKADKLLRLEVDLGYEKRQILSGIAEFYTPEDLVGRRIVVITNLAPRKMRGLESHGMLLAASADEDGKPGKPILATMAEDIALGSRLK